MSKEQLSISEIESLQAALRYTGYSLLVLIVATTTAYIFRSYEPTLYLAGAAAVSYWLCVIWLCAASYSMFMGFIAFLSPLLPGSTLVLMLLGYSRAKYSLRTAGGNAQPLNRAERREPTF